MKAGNIIKVIPLVLLIILSLSGFGFGHQVLIDGATKNFNYKRSITIQGSQVPGANNNYPMLFDSTVDSGLQADLKHKDEVPPGKVQDLNGYDIVFATADGVEILKHEIEQYVFTDGTYRAWVKVDLTGSNQDIYLYYGSTDIAGDTQHTTQVWNDSYDRVFHFHNGSMASSAGGADANDNGTSNTNGIVAGAREFIRSQSDWIDSNFNRDYGQANPLSFEAWWQADAYASQGTRFIIGLLCENEYCLTRLAVRYETGGNDYTQFYLRSRDAGNTGWEGVADYSYDPAETVFDAFHYSVITCDARDDANPKGYYDGQMRDNSNNNFDGYIDFDDISESDIFIGALNENGGVRSGHFDGIIDEVRFAKVELNANWIETTYNNINSPSTFYTIGGSTLVDISYFRASCLDSAVFLEWATLSELDNAGFNIWRSEEKDGEYVRINPYFIPSKGEAGFGAEYGYTDYNVQNGKTYYYKLEDVDVFGNSAIHGPVAAIPNDIILIWPPEGEVLPSHSSLFSWSGFGDSSYKVEISPNPSFSSSKMFSFPKLGWISGNSLWLGPEDWEFILSKVQESGDQLFWRIRARSRDGRKISSEWRRFIIGNPPVPEE